MTNQLYLFLFVLLFFFIVVIIRSYLLWKNAGINPLVFDGSDDAHGFNGRLFKFITIIELVVISIYSFGGDWYDYLLPFWYLENDTLRLVGWVLLIISLIWILPQQ